jgi:hypothetical protein
LKLEKSADAADCRRLLAVAGAEPGGRRRF